VRVSASHRGYPGQLLRTLPISAPATALYEDLHRRRRGGVRPMAARLRAARLGGDTDRAAAEIILGAGYTICDD